MAQPPPLPLFVVLVDKKIHREFVAGENPILNIGSPLSIVSGIWVEGRGTYPPWKPGHAFIFFLVEMFVQNYKVRFLDHFSLYVFLEKMLVCCIVLQVSRACSIFTFELFTRNTIYNNYADEF